MKILHPPVMTGRTQRGLTMIEVLITLVIVSFGLLGAGALQMMSLQVNQNANQRSQAAMLANSMLDAMRVNRYAATQYAQIFGAAVPGASTTDTVQNDRHTIGTRVANTLPNGTMQVTVAEIAATDEKTFYKVTIVIQWDEGGRLVDRNATAVTPTTFTMTSNI